jgi:6-pyruvoyltetrahydropterin/6-carboxytetrahydropterin synthase
MIQVTKRLEFCAAHQIVNPRWSREENQRVFGPCSNLHGHNYLLEVTIQGEPSPVTGMLMDVKALKELIVDAVITKFDHRNLNVDVPYFTERIPTPENMVVVIWGLLEPRLQGCRLFRVRLQEEGSGYVDYYGELAASA